MEQVFFRAMGCQMEARLDADGPSASAALARVSAWFAEWEQRLSRFRADSELSRLNRRAGAPVPVSPILWAAVRAALDAARRTNGLVTPALLPALEAAGYDRPFDLLTAETAVVRPVPPARPAAWRAIQCRPARRLLLLPPGLRLDLGGSAKGWAADRAARRLATLAPALVDAGGDIAVSGRRADGRPWPIAVADPRDDTVDLDLVGLLAGGVATSARTYRRWRQDGAWRHHILDPRTGRPATTDVLSATVVAPSALEAEAAAKAVLILGSQAGLTWLEARPSLAGLLVLEAGPVLRSQRWHDVLLEESA